MIPGVPCRSKRFPEGDLLAGVHRKDSTESEAIVIDQLNTLMPGLIKKTSNAARGQTKC